jgi:hypothetical protein
MSQQATPDNSRVAPVSYPQIEDDGLYDINIVRAFFGGSKPLNAATIYRGIPTFYPPPTRVSPKTSRWEGRALKEAKRLLIEQSRTVIKQKPTSTRRRRAYLVRQRRTRSSNAYHINWAALSRVFTTYKSLGQTRGTKP